MSAAVVIILNPRKRPKSAEAGSEATSYDVEVPEGSSDLEVVQTLLAQLDQGAE